MIKNLKKKKQNQNEEYGFDIVTDIKEPFSFSNFFETQVLERAKRFKAVLADKGILFFLTSPFQARSRLIAEMLVLCVGIAFGVIPRASSMVSELQDHAYASEIAGLEKKSIGSLTITPAASSNYKKMHLLAFIIDGESLPSNPSRYEIHLARGYGASDWNDVTYSWNILPVNDEQRILLMAIDQTKQASGYGAFELFIQLEGEEIEDYAKTPFEVTLSPAQETSKLYDKNGIHLSALTEAVCGAGNISEKQDEFKKTLEEYRIALEQMEAMPIDLTVSPTTDELEAFCLSNRIYRSLTDTSTTNDITNISPVDTVSEFDTDVILTSSGIQYGEEFIKKLEESGNLSDEDNILLEAFETMDNAKTSVISAMTNVNSAAINWYQVLENCKLVLNQMVDIKSFPYTARCTDTINDKIQYIKDSGSSQTDVPKNSVSGSAVSNGPVSTPSGISGSSESDTSSIPELND